MALNYTKEGERVGEKPGKDLYELVLSLSAEVRALREDFAVMGPQLATIKEFMVRTMALEADRNIPTRIEKHAERIENLEHALTAAKAFGWFASGLSLLLTLYLVVKEIAGK